MCIFNKLTFSDHANNAATTIIPGRLDDSPETAHPFCQKHKNNFLAFYQTAYSRLDAITYWPNQIPIALYSFRFSFFLSFCIQWLQQEEYKTANVTLTREMLTTQGLLLHWVVLWVFCKETYFWTWH